MAKVIKSMQINVVSEDGAAISRCMAVYEVASSDDESLRKSAYIEIPLSGQALTDIQAVFNGVLALAEDAEGIV